MKQASRAIRRATVVVALAAVLLLTGKASVLATDLSDLTKKQLAAMHLDPSIMDGLDQELAIPQAWSDAAKAEPTVEILGTWSSPEWKQLYDVFHARYPLVKVEFVRSSRDNRQVQSLMAFKQGRYVADIISSFSDVYPDLHKANGLADLRDLPTFNHGVPGSYDPDGSWVSERLSYWCMSYNTDMVKAADLPKEWGDLITNPFWRDGRFAVSNAPSGWLTVLYHTKGADWTRDFITKLFVEVKPQRRNEGRDASVQLAGAGEMAAVAPSSDFRTHEFAKQGSPVSFHCPSIVPTAPALLGILRGSPAPSGAKIFLNWFLSKEGQLTLHTANGSVSAHKDFQRPEFLNYPDEIQGPGKQVVFDTLDPGALDAIQKLWTLGWNNELPGQYTRLLSEVQL
jgi:iron(III) transport system substrate-binding protein